MLCACARVADCAGRAGCNRLNPTLHVVTELMHAEHASYVRPVGNTLDDAAEVAHRVGRTNKLIRAQLKSADVLQLLAGLQSQQPLNEPYSSSSSESEWDDDDHHADHDGAGQATSASEPGDDGEDHKESSAEKRWHRLRDVAMSGKSGRAKMDMVRGVLSPPFRCVPCYSLTGVVKCRSYTASFYRVSSLQPIPIPLYPRACACSPQPSKRWPTCPRARQCWRTR